MNILYFLIVMCLFGQTLSDGMSVCLISGVARTSRVLNQKVLLVTNKNRQNDNPSRNDKMEGDAQLPSPPSPYTVMVC